MKTSRSILSKKIVKIFMILTTLCLLSKAALASETYHVDLDGDGTTETIRITGRTPTDARGRRNYEDGYTRVDATGSVHWHETFMTFTRGEYDGKIYFHDLDNDSRLELIIITKRYDMQILSYSQCATITYYKNVARVYRLTDTKTGLKPVKCVERIMGKDTGFTPLYRDLNGDGILEVIIPNSIKLGMYQDYPFTEFAVYGDALYVLDISGEGYAGYATTTPSASPYGSNQDRSKYTDMFDFERFGFQDKDLDGNEEIFVTGEMYSLDYEGPLLYPEPRHTVTVVFHYESTTDTHELVIWTPDITVIEGHVRDEQGNPIRGAQITMSRLFPFHLDELCFTDQNGYYRYVIAKEILRDYTGKGGFVDLVVSHDDYSFMSKETDFVFNNVISVSGPDAAAQLKTIERPSWGFERDEMPAWLIGMRILEFRLLRMDNQFNRLPGDLFYNFEHTGKRVYTLKGKVRYRDGTAITDREVDVYACTLDKPVTINYRGEFTQKRLPPDDFWFVALPIAYNWDVPDGDNYQWLINSTDFGPEFDAVKTECYLFKILKTDQDISGLTFIAENPVVKGCVKDGGKDGTPLEGVTVELTSDGETLSRLTDSSGEYEFTGLYNGSYTISASDTGHPDYDFGPERTVEVQKTTVQDFYTYTISGQVVDGAGKGINGVTVMMDDPTRGGDSPEYTTVTGDGPHGETGYYEQRVTPGTYDVETAEE